MDAMLDIYPEDADALGLCGVAKVWDSLERLSA